MSEGQLQWIDAEAGVARIVRGGHEYDAPLAEVDPHARVPGARVVFDVRHDGPVPTAGAVRLAAGTRIGPRQRRFGELAGARHPGDKAQTVAHHQAGVDVETQPTKVARRWAQAMTHQQLPDALSLYAPEARVHVGEDVAMGRRHIQGCLEAWPGLGIGVEPADVHADDRVVWLGWPAAEARPELEVAVIVDRGRIVEQWLTGAEAAGLEAGAEEMQVVARGDVPEEAVRYAADKVAKLVDQAHEPILFRRVKLGWSGDPAVAKRATAEAALDVNGTLVRAHVAAHTLHEAADLLERRVRDRLQHRADRERHRALGEPAEPGEWRHGNLPADRPPYFDRPFDERELVRHKTFAAEELTAEEAAWDMHLLDYDFFLFRELASGRDSVLWRGDTGLSLAQAGGVADRHALGTAADVVTVRPEPAPRLTVREAIERLDAGNERFVFFENGATARGNVVYRRYDGDYGLIAPSAEPAPAS